MGKELADFIGEYSEWVILLRKNLMFPCTTCFNPETKSPNTIDTLCRVCWATGYRTTPVVVPSRIVRGTAVQQNEGLENRMPGWIELYHQTIVFPRGVRPSEGDVVLSVEWDRDPNESSPVRPRPVSLTGVWVLVSLNEHFEREFGWFSCGLEKLPVETSIYRRLLPLMGDLRQFRETSWQSTSYW